MKGLTDKELYWLGHFLYHYILKDDLNVDGGVGSETIDKYCRHVSSRTGESCAIDADDIGDTIRRAIYTLDSAARHVIPSEVAIADKEESL